MEQRLYRQFTGQSSIDCGGRGRGREREHGKAHAECTSKRARARHLERRRRRRRKAHSNVLSSGALQQISHLRLEHGRVVSFEAELLFLRARACARVLFVQKVALGESSNEKRAFERMKISAFQTRMVSSSATSPAATSRVFGPRETISRASRRAPPPPSPPPPPRRPGCRCSLNKEYEFAPKFVTGDRFLQLHLDKQNGEDDRSSSLLLSMYSSHVNAITTNPSCFVLKVDDHGFHRGHAVFDTVSIDVKTKVFQDLGVHLERLATSASMAFIPFPKRLHSLELVEKVVKETVRCAFEERERRGFVTSSESSMQARFYLCAGVGGFSLSLKECTEGSTFYCVVIERTKENQTSDAGKTKSVKPKAFSARTTPIAVKNKPFSTIKSTNYLQNAMIQNDAEMHDADVGIWVSNDKVLEGPSANVAFVDERGVFIAPKVDDVLDGVTMRRCFEFIEKGLLKDVGVIECERRDCSFRELILDKRAKECMMIGSVVQCVPIEKWDNLDINRDEGDDEDRFKVAVRLKELLEKDARGVVV